MYIVIYVGTILGLFLYNQSRVISSNRQSSRMALAAVTLNNKL